jgi:hypothetical protein
MIPENLCIKTLKIEGWITQVAPGAEAINHWTGFPFGQKPPPLLQARRGAIFIPVIIRTVEPAFSSLEFAH